MAPDNQDHSEKALFLILCFLKEYPEKKNGALDHYLLAELKSDGFKLVAASDKKLTEERFKFFVNIITRKPGLVKNLVLTGSNTS